MSLAKYFSYITLGMSLSACASQAPYVSSKVKPEVESIYPGKVVAIRVCDGMDNCTEWKTPEGLPYLVDSWRMQQEYSGKELPPPRLISRGSVPFSASKPAQPKEKLPTKPIEDIVIDEEPVCEGDSCRIPGR